LLQQPKKGKDKILNLLPEETKACINFTWKKIHNHSTSKHMVILYTTLLSHFVDVALSINPWILKTKKPIVDPKAD
jgi:hypothetical protein